VSVRSDYRARRLAYAGASEIGPQGGQAVAERSALLVSPAQERPERTWQSYEAEVGRPGHRAISLATSEMFLLLTGQHPAFVLTARVPRQPLHLGLG
jgi:hypothetical protein